MAITATHKGYGDSSQQTRTLLLRKALYGFAIRWELAR